MFWKIISLIIIVIFTSLSLLFWHTIFIAPVKARRECAQDVISTKDFESEYKTCLRYSGLIN